MAEAGRAPLWLSNPAGGLPYGGARPTAHREHRCAGTAVRAGGRRARGAGRRWSHRARALGLRYLGRRTDTVARSDPDLRVPRAPSRPARHARPPMDQREPRARHRRCRWATAALGAGASSASRGACLRVRLRVLLHRLRRGSQPAPPVGAHAVAASPRAAGAALLADSLPRASREAPPRSEHRRLLHLDGLAEPDTRRGRLLACAGAGHLAAYTRDAPMACERGRYTADATTASEARTDIKRPGNRRLERT